MAAESSPLTLQERVRAAIGLGESHFREFKSALQGPPEAKEPRDARTIRKDIGEALVAFANADGGELIVGVEDDGSVTGIRHPEASIASFSESWQTQVHHETPIPPPRVARVELDGQQLLYFGVQKGTDSIYLTSDGRCMQRRDRESRPVASELIHLERQEQISREYDRQFVDGVDPAVLDLDVVERVADQVAPGLSPEKTLQLLDLAEFAGPGVSLRRAAILLFARDVSRWHPRCEVRILRVAGTELQAGREYNVVNDTHIVGSILDLLTKAWEEIRPYLVETRLGPDGRFEEQVRYPEDACREALTNAIAHRDYSIEGRAIEVYVFDDRLEVRSPGSLLSTVTIEGIRSLEGVHQSRNTTIARTLRELGYMREMGEGFRRIFQLMRAHDLVEPEIHTDPQGFTVSLRHRSVFSEEDQRWVEAYEHFRLERDEEKVLLLGRSSKPLSVQQIMGALDLVDTEDYRALIARLLEKGLLRSLPKKTRQTRSSPRWEVIQPRDANIFFSDLLARTRPIYTGSGLTRRDFQKIAESLRADSPYNPEALKFTFRRLGLIDNHDQPSGQLRLALDSPTTPTVPDSAKMVVIAPAPPSGAASLDTDDLHLAASVAEGRDPSKIFVGNLSFDVEAIALLEIFSSVGEVASVELPASTRFSGQNRGYAFVRMATPDAANSARLNLEGEVLGGRPMRLEWAKS